MAKHLLLPFSFLLPLCFSLGKDRPHSPTKSVWSKVQVQTTWIPPKTEYEPKGTPVRYSWSSISGSSIEILPIKAKYSPRLSLNRDGKNIPLTSFPSPKNGWKAQIG